MKMYIRCMALAAVIVLGFAGTIMAEDGSDEVRIRPGEISGEISAISQRYISIIYSKDFDNNTEYEMLLPIDENVKFTRKSLDKLEVGDQVSVKCDDHIKKNAEGEDVCARRVAKEISFVRPAMKDKLVGTER